MARNNNEQRLELWGGVEPTINRIGDRYLRQFDRSGHRERLSDLDEFARLGLRTLRFPILWEEIAPEAPDTFDWSALDAPLQRLRELGIRPIAGLLHHGSGPRYTSLMDPEFPERLARFARAVAERYPWIDAYTPVNEPLTTARFSGMYGLWYPHGRDERTFAQCLMNQCRGIVLAMREIRAVNRRAELVQTDDLGKIYSTPKLRYQADFENERRWVTWDLLCGTLSADRPIWHWLRSIGVSERDLAVFEESPCPPDIIGVNHYVTSERLLDENLAAHPPEAHGGNGRDRYADVVAVRARREGIAGAEGVLREAWERYRLPLAVTEAHIGCTREEQLRWLAEIWGGARKLRDEGIDVCAVTVWSLLGAYDWSSLLTRNDGCYEPGAFDLRGGTLRPTAIARMIEALTHGRPFDHPSLETPGWWHRTVRLLTTPVSAPETAPPQEDQCLPTTSLIEVPPAAFAGDDRVTGRPILITGGGGRLAQGFVRAAQLRGLAYRLYSHGELDIANAAAVGAALESAQPWAVINCAGFSRVDDAESAEQACIRANTHGAATLAASCARTGIPLLTFSSDHVFDGSKRQPYVESDEPCALNIYGESKLLAERQVLAAFPRALIIRPGRVFAAHDDGDFFSHSLRAIARGERVRVENEIRISGTYLPDFVHAALDLLIDDESGVWHLANSGAITPEQFLIAAADLLHLDSDRIEGAPIWRLNHAALQPRYRVLHSERGQLLPPLEGALERYCSVTDISQHARELLVAS